MHEAAPQTDAVRGLAQELAAGIERVYEAPTPDNLHELRVGIARFKAISSAVRMTHGRRGMGRVRKSLRWLRRRTSATRDWDVFIADQHLRHHLRRRHIRFAVPERELAARRRNALDLVAGALREQRCLNLEAQLLALAAQPGGGLDQKAAKRAFARQQRKVRRLGRHFRHLDDAGLHALRGALKELRYTCELLQRDGEPQTEQYLTSLAHLVHVLGRLQDAVSGTALAQTLACDLRKPVRSYYKQRAHRLRRRAIDAWADFSHCREPA